MDGQKIVDVYFKLRFSIFFLLTFAAVFSFVIIPVYGADPFDEFVFQGILKDSGGALVTATKDITLKIYTILSGGTSIWEEEHDNVSVSNGIFTVFAGSVNSFANDLNFTNAYFLEVRIEDSNGNNPEILSPRIKIGGSPFSLSSARASVDFDLNKKNVINATSLNATSLEIDQTGSSLAANITNTGTGDSFRVNDAPADTTPFLIDNSGNVGIGTTSPGENLEIEVSDTSDPAITFDSDGNEFTIGIDSSDGDKFKISDNTALGTNDRFVIDSSGNVTVSGNLNVPLGYVVTPFGGFGTYQNLLKFSEELDNAIWTKPSSRVTVTADNAIAPNGEMSADTAQWTVSTLGLRQSFTLTDGATYTVSFWGRLSNDVSGGVIAFDLGDGASKSITFTDTWSRASVTLVAGNSDWLDLTHFGTSGFELWGLQVVNGGEELAYVHITDQTVATANFGLVIDGDLLLGADNKLVGEGGEGLSIDSSGNVGIGTSTPSEALEVSGNALFSGFVNATSLEIDQTGSSLAVNITNTGTGDSFRVNDAISDTTPFLIDASGNVGIGDAAPDDRLDVVGDLDVTSGCIQIDDGTALHGTCASDARLKENIQYFEDGSLDLISQLKPASFEWREDMFDISGSKGQSVGFIAQDFEKVFPYLVLEKNGFKYILLNNEIDMHLIQAIKELKTENDALKELICLDHPEADICNELRQHKFSKSDQS